MSIYENFTFSKQLNKEDIVFRRRGNFQNAQLYSDTFISLDTETSHNHNEENYVGWIYQWAFKFNNQIIYGRSPEDLCIQLSNISKTYNLNENKRIVAYCHNLPFDFSYLCQFFQKHFGTPLKVLAYANHKLFCITYKNGLEFRCSYKLSNKSLDKWSKDLNVKHKKLLGTIDYDIIRNQNTTLLTSKDWKYMFYDVITLDECIRKQLANYNDTISTIPYTSTGYVRREIKRRFKANYRINRNFFEKLRLNYKTYNAYRSNFAGGITHGDRSFANKTIVTYINNDELTKLKKIYGSNDDIIYVEGKIKHNDFTSHYPTQQICKLFPIDTTTFYATNYPIEKLKDLRNQGYGILCKVTLGNYELTDKAYPIPYIQYAKCCLNYYKNSDYIVDNGRVLANSGYTTLYLFYEELKTIIEQYTIDYLNIDEVYISKLGTLPEYLNYVINKSFKGKSDYKIQEEKAIINDLSEIQINDIHTNLMKSKNVLNGIYGCTATDIVREEFELTNNNWTSTKKSTEEEITKALNDYYKKKTSCLAYEWGAYTTMYARMQLLECVNIIYKYYNSNTYTGSIIYADTDSCFYIDDINDTIEKEINKYNENLRFINDKNHYYIINENYEKIYYNQFTSEKEDIEAFRFLHSKCYVYKERHKAMDKMKVTIAGVSGLNSEKAKELKHINNLKKGFKFKKCGGKSAKYIYADTIFEYNGNICADSCIITSVEKTMNDMTIDKEYAIIKTNIESGDIL